MKTFAFVFPGQGSQTVGMLDAWGDHPAVLQTLQEASTALGMDVARLIHAGPAARTESYHAPAPAPAPRSEPAPKASSSDSSSRPIRSGAEESRRNGGR